MARAADPVEVPTAAETTTAAAEAEPGATGAVPAVTGTSLQIR